MDAKRALDLFGAALALLVFGVPMALLALLVRRDVGSPVLFRQVRPGKDGRSFTLLKFRTMRHGEAGDHARLTPFGRLLRRTSLDELPEFWNVLRGDMSLVGPRPLLTEYLDLYSPDQARRHEVKPGITGWAQVNGRNAIGWKQKFAHDVWYVNHRSLELDLKILWMTFVQLIKREGVSAPGHETMPKFTGNE